MDFFLFFFGCLYVCLCSIGNKWNLSSGDWYDLWMYYYLCYEMYCNGFSGEIEEELVLCVCFMWGIDLDNNFLKFF